MARRPIAIDRLPQYGTLLGAMLLDIVVTPMVAALGAGLLASRLMMVVVLVAAFFAVGTRRASVATFLVALGGLVVSSLWTSRTAITVELLLRMMFVGYVSAHVLIQVLQRREVTADTIAGAACVYMLLGLLWATAYLLLEHLHPGSFVIPPAWRLTGNEIGPALTYFSYVTLTTVGYGDVTPAGPAAGGLAVVEAAVGQLFLAVTIARLVGLHIARRD